MMDERRVFIVTGAAGGIGGAIAHRFVKDGCVVVAVDLCENGLLSTRSGCSAPEAFVPLVSDITNDRSAEIAIDTAIGRFGRLDGLVNNAGIAGAKPVHLTEDDEYGRMMDVTVGAAFRFSRAAVRQFAQGSGCIVHISSVFGLVGSKGSSAYAAGKAALIGLTRQMAIDYGPQGVRTNTIAPGLVATPMTQDRIDHNDAFRRMMVDTTPSPRIGRPEDIAAAAAFLCSSDAGFINGHTLVVDGGWSVTNFISG